MGSSAFPGLTEFPPATLPLGPSSASRSGGSRSTTSERSLATCPNAGLAHQTHYQRLADDVIRGGPPQFEDGGLALPDAPGIGVELDRDRVAEFAELYSRDGFFSPYEPHAP